MDQNALMNLLISLVTVLGIVIVIGLIVWVFWTVWYIPIHKELEYDEKKRNLEKEFLTIDAKTKRREEDLKNEDEMFKIKAAANHNLQIDINNKIKQVDRLEKTIEDLKLKISNPDMLLDLTSKKSSSSKKSKKSEDIDTLDVYAGDTDKDK